MKKKNMQTLGICTAISLLLSVFIIPISIADSSEDVDFSIKVWNPRIGELGGWDQTANLDVGEIARFNITLTYSGNLSLIDIHIKNTIPITLAIDLSSIHINFNEQPEPNIINNTIYWNFTSAIWQQHPALYIEYNATILYSAEAHNQAQLSAYEGGEQTPVNMDSEATVIISPFVFEKLVMNKQGQWTTGITAIYGDFIRFKLALTYYAHYNLTDINFVDELPEFLNYSDSSSENIEVSANKKTIWFNFTDILQFEDSITVEFNATITEPGPIIGVNLATANVTHKLSEIVNITYEKNAHTDVSIILNSPPLEPDQPIGTGNGLVGENYQYLIRATDPDDDDVFYRVNWSDGNMTEWLGPYPSGQRVTVDHTWMSQDTFLVFVQAKDVRGDTGPWTDDPWHYKTVVISGEFPQNDPPAKPITPIGNSTGLTGQAIKFTTRTTDPDGDLLKYGWDWTNDGLVDQWVPGEGENLIPSGENCSIFITFNVPGRYYIKVKANDSYRESIWSNAKQINITGNFPPKVPVIRSGPSYGSVNDTYTFTANTTDPDGDNISYDFSWGDGTFSGWTGLILSGATAAATHKWTSPGTYSVKVKAKDEHGLENGTWSAVKTITINGSGKISIMSISGLLGVNVVIQNDANQDLTGVNWTIKIKGQRTSSRINSTKTGTVSIDADGETTAKAMVFGLGKIKITATARYANEDGVQRTANAFLLGFLVINVN
ncbi:MAG: PKD domain-containing protein [Methanobacteriota archaeon]